MCCAYRPYVSTTMGTSPNPAASHSAPNLATFTLSAYSLAAN